MSLISSEIMQRLRLLRVSVPSSSGSGIRRRPFSVQPQHPRQQFLPTTRLTLSGTASCFSTGSSNHRSKYEDIPKRIYQSAPKRQHGKHAGMKKWSSPKHKQGLLREGADAPSSSSQDGKGTMSLALGGPRAAELREVSSGLKEIRVSPWTLNLLARLVRGLPVVEAAAQLEFCKKKHTGTVFKAIQNALNLADMRYGLVAEQMMVHEIFVTKGHVVKRMRIMGRGRAGISTRKWSHLNVTLKEMDLDAEIDAAESKNRRQKLKERKIEVQALLAQREPPATADGEHGGAAPLHMDAK